MIPAVVRNEVESTLEQRTGRPTAIARSGPVGGGCINPSARVETTDGDAYFIKWNAEAPRDMFAAEADGLAALAAADAVKVPEVVGRGDGENGGPAWLLLEFVPRGRGGPGYEARLGRGMAALHRKGAAAACAGGAKPGGAGEVPGFGWERDNWIGSLPQPNAPPADAGDWAAFWRERRIGPQLRRAREGGFFRGADGEVMDRLLGRVDEALADAAATPSLLHGDLWGGNVFPGPEDEPVVIDPAVYRGHREVDLAMSELFGFPRGFLAAYREAWPLDEGYEGRRRDLYQLYYLLVHVNLFGASYVGGCLTAAGAVLASL